MHVNVGLVVGLVALALSGCAGGAIAPAAAPLLAGCGAHRLTGLIGAPVAALPARPATGTLRILRPGDPVTKDFSPTRLNVILDDGDRITAVSCG